MVALCLVNIQTHSFYQGSQPVLGAWARELFQVWVKHFREFPVSEISWQSLKLLRVEPCLLLLTQMRSALLSVWHMLRFKESMMMSSMKEYKE